MKTISVLSALAFSVSVAAAPLAAEEVKPVKPTVSSQGGALALGTLTPAATAALIVVGIAVVGAIADGGSSSQSPDSE